MWQNLLFCSEDISFIYINPVKYPLYLNRDSTLCQPIPFLKKNCYQVVYCIHFDYFYIGYILVPYISLKTVWEKSKTFQIKCMTKLKENISMTCDCSSITYIRIEEVNIVINASNFPMIGVLNGASCEIFIIVAIKKFVIFTTFSNK